MLRKSKLFVRPRKPFESGRIKEENELVKKYGLKNKKEIWRALAKVNYYRKRAMELANSTFEEQEVLLGKLRALGLNVNTTADALGLRVENLLDRRLPTVVAKKKIATTTKGARQMVVHKKILVNGSVINSPSYIVSVSEESSIKLKPAKKRVPKVEQAPESDKDNPAMIDNKEQVPDNEEGKE